MKLMKTYILGGLLVLQETSPVASFVPPSPIFSDTLRCRACGSSWASLSRAPAGCFGNPRARWVRESLRSRIQGGRAVHMSSPDIESPFARPDVTDDMDDDDDDDDVLPLTLDNVEAVLDEMRPYLMSDG